MAGVALGDIFRFTWLAWHLATTFVLRGRRGTCGTGLALVAGVALGDIYLCFAWQAWHLRHWAGSGGALGRALVAGETAVLCMAGVALGDIYLRFAWQAWRLRHWAGSGGALGRHLPSFCVAGVALAALGWLWWRLGALWSPVTAWYFAWQAWHLATSFVSLGWRGTWRHLPCFAWQAWHLRHWAGSGGALGRALVAGDAVALAT